jgi:hypothetical protein
VDKWDGMDKTGAAHARATEITAVTITFLVTAWMAVLARTWVRAVMIRNYGWDDAVMLLAVLFVFRGWFVKFGATSVRK